MIAPLNFTPLYHLPIPQPRMTLPLISAAREKIDLVLLTLYRRLPMGESVLLSPHQDQFETLLPVDLEPGEGIYLSIPTYLEMYQLDVEICITALRWSHDLQDVEDMSEWRGTIHQLSQPGFQIIFS